MSVGRPNPNPNLIIPPEVYEANRARIQAGKAVLEAAELENEQGRRNHDILAEELRAKITAGEEARRALEQLEAARNSAVAQNPVISAGPSLIAPTGYEAADVITTSRIEEVPAHNATHSTGSQTQSSWSASTAQNGSYASNHTSSHNAPTTRSYSNNYATNNTPVAGPPTRNPYAALINNYANNIQPTAQGRANYGAIHQSYQQQQYHGTGYTQQTAQARPTLQQHQQHWQSQHHNSVAPSSNHQAEQSIPQYPPNVYNYTAQQPQQYVNKSRETSTTTSQTVLAAASLGKQKAYQPASGSSSLDGALTPVSQSNTRAGARTQIPPSSATFTQPSHSLNGASALAGRSDVQAASHQNLVNGKQPQSSSSSWLHPSTSGTSVHQAESSSSSQQSVGTPSGQPGAHTPSSSFTSTSNRPSTSSESSAPELSLMLERARNYIITFATGWSEQAPPHSFVTIPHLPAYQLYKGYDSKLRIVIKTERNTKLTAVDDFLKSDLPVLLVKKLSQTQSAGQPQASATTLSSLATRLSSSHTSQPEPTGTSSTTTATISTSSLAATSTIPNTAFNRSATASMAPVTNVSHLDATSAPFSLAPSANMSATPSMPNTSLPNIVNVLTGHIPQRPTQAPRTPAQVDKKHLARDILRVLKRSRPSDLHHDREAKRHASEGAIVAGKTNNENESVHDPTKETTAVAPSTTERNATPSTSATMGGVQIVDTHHHQSPTSVANIQKLTATESQAAPTAVTTTMAPSNPPLSHPPPSTLASNENKVIRLDSAPPTSAPHEIIVIEDDPQLSTPNVQQKDVHIYIPDTPSEQPQVSRRSLSPEIPVASLVKRAQTLSAFSSPPVKLPVTHQVSHTNGSSSVDPFILGHSGSLVPDKTPKGRKVPYVLVPPSPKYVLRHKEAVARHGSSQEPASGSRSRSRGGANDGAIDFQVETLPPYTYDETEREAVRVSCTRLREAPCKWNGCDIVMNSVQALIIHLKADHKPLGGTHKPYTCLWKNCGHRCVDGRMSLDHVDRHPLNPLYCAYKGCDEFFRGPGQLVKHNELRHRNSTLKWTADLQPIKALESLPSCPGVVLTTMIDTVAIMQPSIPQSRHAALAPYVLKNISGPVHLKAERYDSARKPLKGSKYGKNEEEDGSDGYDCLITGASLKHYSSILSSPAKVRGTVARVHSEEVSKMAHDGLLFLFGPPDEKESPPGTPTLVSGFHSVLASDDADEEDDEVRPEEFDNLELKRWVPLPDASSTSRPDRTDEEDTVESMLTLE